MSMHKGTLSTIIAVIVSIAITAACVFGMREVGASPGLTIAIGIALGLIGFGVSFYTWSVDGDFSSKGDYSALGTALGVMAVGAMTLAVAAFTVPVGLGYILVDAGLSIWIAAPISLAVCAGLYIGASKLMDAVSGAFAR